MGFCLSFSSGGGIRRGGVYPTRFEHETHTVYRAIPRGSKDRLHIVQMRVLSITCLSRKKSEGARRKRGKWRRRLFFYTPRLFLPKLCLPPEECLSRCPRLSLLPSVHTTPHHTRFPYLSLSVYSSPFTYIRSTLTIIM